VAAFATTTVRAVELRNPRTFFSGDAVDIQDYLDWVNTVNYRGMYYLPSDMDPADGAAIHWNIDEELGILELAVAVRATGWLGFGISENGGMLGSDMLIFETLDPTIVKDAHVKDYRYPETDSCQSWELISASTDTEFLIVEVRRKLDTEGEWLPSFFAARNGWYMCVFSHSIRLTLFWFFGLV
jgi:DOMON domain